MKILNLKDLLKTLFLNKTIYPCAKFSRCDNTFGPPRPPGPGIIDISEI